MMSRSAFTLIEMLVVIALVGILAAMLFPVISQAKIPAKSTVCLSNLRSIAAGIDLYAQDADSRYPVAADAGDKFSKIATLRKDLPLLTEVLAPYITSREVWKCPLDRGVPNPLRQSDEPILDLIPGTAPSVFARYGSSYGYDSRLGTQGVPHPASLYDEDGKTEHGPSEIPISMDLYSRWHGSATSRRANVLFADDHVRSLPWPDYIQSGAWTSSPPQTHS